jgi:hypothetical protein
LRRIAVVDEATLVGFDPGMMVVVAARKTGHILGASGWILSTMVNVVTIALEPQFTRAAFFRLVAVF